MSTAEPIPDKGLPQQLTPLLIWFYFTQPTNIFLPVSNLFIHKNRWIYWKMSHKLWLISGEGFRRNSSQMKSVYEFADGPVFEKMKFSVHFFNIAILSVTSYYDRFLPKKIWWFFQHTLSCQKVTCLKLTHFWNFLEILPKFVP